MLQISFDLRGRIVLISLVVCLILIEDVSVCLIVRTIVCHPIKLPRELSKLDLSEIFRFININLLFQNQLIINSPMATFKQDKAKIYASKNAHLRREKDQRRITLERSFPKIQKMNPQQLVHFMENTFDDFTYRNNDKIVHIHKAIFQRVEQLCKQFDSKNFKNYCEFLQKGGVQYHIQSLQKDQIGYLYIKHRQYHNFNGTNQLYSIFRIIIHPNNKQLRQTAYFATQFKPTADYKNLYKRIKKESIQVLGKLIEIAKKIEELNN